MCEFSPVPGGGRPRLHVYCKGKVPGGIDAGYSYLGLWRMMQTLLGMGGEDMIGGARSTARIMVRFRSWLACSQHVQRRLTGGKGEWWISLAVVLEALSRLLGLFPLLPCVPVPGLG